jgi:hypothetical protein
VADAVLTERERNRAVLARQLLLERAKLPLPKVLEKVGGIQAQYAPSMYIGLWSRIEGFDRDDLTEALEEKKVVQGTLMRQTIHLVSKADWWPIQVAVREPRRKAWAAYGDRAGREKEVVAAVKKIKKAMANGEMSRKEVMELTGADSVVFNGTQAFLDQVRVPPAGTWDRRRADVFLDAEQWIGPEKGSEAAGRKLLVERYLTGFGPAEAKDIADWAGIPPKLMAPVIEKMKLKRFESESGKELLDLPRMPLPDPDTPAPVRFLPTWDAVLLAHARNTGVIAEEDRKKIFSTKTPQSVPTFMVDGRVAGTWKWDDKKKKVETKPFGKLDAKDKKEVKAEADRLAEFHA